MSTLSVYNLQGLSTYSNTVRIPSGHNLETNGTVTTNGSLVANGTLKIPTWTTSTRPASPTSGMVGFNTTLKVTEVYNGVIWQAVGNSGADLDPSLQPFLWYKGDDLISITDSANVTSMLNRGTGGGTYNLETGSNGIPPLKATINGYPSLYWPSESARHLRFLGGTGLSLVNGGSFGNQGFTSFWVSRCGASFASHYGAGGAFVPFCGYPGGGTHSSFGHIYTAGSGSTDQRWGLLWENDGFVPYAGNSGNRSPNPGESGGAGYPAYENIPAAGFFGAESATQWGFRHMGNSDPVPSLTTGWLNRTGNPFFQTKYSALYPTGYTATSNVTIRGVGAARSNFWLGGWILEILLWNRALTDTEVTSVRNYLGQKYSNFGNANV